jgi:hypothetical protein
MEVYYNFANFVEYGKEQLFNDKIGALDLESMTNNISPGAPFPLNEGEYISESDVLGLGEHIIYAGG